MVGFLKILPKEYISQTIGKQLLRSATSIGANVIEAQASPSKKDFANFYNIALKSGNETKYWLLLIKATDKVVVVDQLLNEAIEICNILGKSLVTLRK